MKRKKKPANQVWTKKIDDFCSDLVKFIVGYRCERCGKLGRQGGGQVILNWAHIEGRGKKEVRWGFFDKEFGYIFNAFCLCVGCHWWFDNSTNRGDVYDWLETKLGRAKWMLLRERARETKPWGVGDYEAKMAELEHEAFAAGKE